MAIKQKAVAQRYYSGLNLPAAVIRRYAKLIAEQFHPDKIILFGSRAYGIPHIDSDVDLLVVMPARNELDQAVKIRLAIPAEFPLDLVVIKPKRLADRLEDGDWFLREIVSKGKVLYDKDDKGMDQKGRRRLSTAASKRKQRQPVSQSDLLPLSTMR